MRPLLIIIVAAGAGFGLGAWLKHSPTPAASIKLPLENHAPTSAPPPPRFFTLVNGNSEDALIAYCGGEIPWRDIPAALRQLGPFASSNLLQSLFARWAAEDPAAAMDFFKTFGIPDASGESIGKSILAAWAEKDAANAAAFAQREIDASETMLEREELWRTLAKFDAAAAFKKGLTSLTEMNGIFGEWVKQDWNAAAAALEKLPPGARLEQASYEVLDQAMKRDPQAALAWFRGLPDSIRAAVGMYNLLGRYGDAPREVKYSLLGEQLLGFGHHDEISTALRSAQKADDSTRAESFTKLSNAVGAQVGNDLNKWAKEDPAGALKWAAQFPDQTLKPVLMGEFGKQLITDGKVSEGLQAMQQLPMDTQTALIKLSAKDVNNESAASIAEQIPEGPLRNAFLGEIK